jgi:hypothetical protein
MEKFYDVYLTAQELLLLDGKVRENIQKTIDACKQELSVGFDMPVMNEVILASLKNGMLTWRFKGINHCPYCNKTRDYAKYKRDSANHRKGEDDYNKPISYFGVAFNEGFIASQNRGDMCQECFKEKKVLERLIDYILDKDLKIQIQKNEYKPTRYKKDEIRICYNCKKEMQESKMGRSPGLMGPGTYPSTCPECGAESIFLGKHHECTNKFVMLPV